MSTSEETEYQSFEEDLKILLHTLAESFESTEVEHYVDDHNDILYVKLEGLQDYDESEIEEIAGPILEELDMNFEEIVLLPLWSGHTEPHLYLHSLRYLAQSL